MIVSSLSEERILEELIFDRKIMANEARKIARKAVLRQQKAGRDGNIVDAICCLSTGVSYPAISASRLSSISIAIPPLAEQQAIATYLDEKCAKIDAAVENIGKQIEASKRLKRAIINEAISGKTTI